MSLKRRYLIYYTRRVIKIIFIKYVEIQKNGKPNNFKILGGKKTKRAKQDSRNQYIFPSELFLTFASLGLVLFWQLFYLFCSSIVLNTVIVTGGTFEP